MPLARTYDPALGEVVSTARDGFLDRLSRDSDIKEYLPFLFETAASYPNVRVLELGTRRGNSTLAFLAAAEAVNGHVWSVDIDRVTDAPDGMMPWRKCPGWTFIQGDDLHPAVRAKLPAEVDVLFVDTSHEYDHTLEECRAYMPRLAPGGVALFHDTTSFPPVAQALDTWCEETGRTWENRPGEYGLGVIQGHTEAGDGAHTGGPVAVSVLIPTRGRAENLAGSVESLRRLARDVSAVEILVAADPDDEDTITVARDLCVTLHVAPCRYGYEGLHHYYNYLASQAAGEWLMLWNDDCRMLTRHWDDVIRDAPPGILHLDTMNYIPQHNSFPVVPAAWARLLGYISPTFGVDLWWHALGQMTGLTQPVPVRVRHARINDDMIAAERDARDIRGELDSFNSPEAQLRRWNDAQKLQELLGRPPLEPGGTDAVVFRLQPARGIENMWQAEDTPEACE